MKVVAVEDIERKVDFIRSMMEDIEESIDLAVDKKDYDNAAMYSKQLRQMQIEVKLLYRLILDHAQEAKVTE